MECPAQAGGGTRVLAVTFAPTLPGLQGVTRGALSLRFEHSTVSKLRPSHSATIESAAHWGLREPGRGTEVF